MRNRRVPPELRYDRTLRAVMWMDAFLSLLMALVCLVAAPVLTAVDVSHGVAVGIGIAGFACAVPLAAFGAITGVLLMMRMHAGAYGLPPRMRLPLPSFMHPPLG